MSGNKLYIKNISEYLEIINQLTETYSVPFSNDKFLHSTFLCRGLSKQEYKLVPGIFRSIEIDNIENDLYKSFASELGILRNFILEASAYYQIAPTEIVKWCELAQHYGVPTRLLDWTGNPLIALYFACEKDAESDACVDITTFRL